MSGWNPWLLFRDPGDEIEEDLCDDTDWKRQKEEKL